MPSRLSREEVVTIKVLHEKGVSGRAIARQLGVREGTVRYRLGRLRSAAEDGRQGKASRAAVVGAVIEAWQAEHADGDRPLNVRDLYEHLRDACGYEGSYKSVLRYVRRRWGRPPIRTYRRVETVPGAQAQTDWGEHPRIDIGEGPEWLSSFVMTLSHSRMLAVVWSRGKDLLAWLHCHNEAFRRLGGIPAVNRIDNVKTAIVHGAGAWGEIHPVYGSYARGVGFHVDACAPRAPEAKGKAEAKVKLPSRLLALGRRRHDGLRGLQAETDAAVAAWAERAVCPVTGESVADSWRAELAHLRPVPVLPEPFDVSVRRPVQHDGLVHFEGRAYAVPFTYAGREVEVRGCAGTVQIFAGDALLRCYARHTASRLLIDPSCYEGASTERVLAPTPLGKMGRRLAEIAAMPVEQRPLDLYAALAEVAR